ISGNTSSRATSANAATAVSRTATGDAPKNTGAARPTSSWPSTLERATTYTVPSAAQVATYATIRRREGRGTISIIQPQAMSAGGGDMPPPVSRGQYGDANARQTPLKRRTSALYATIWLSSSAN